MKATLSAAALAALLCASPGAAQTPVPVPTFDSIELQGGGRVVVRHGPAQRVMLVRGNLEMTRFTVTREGQLEIRACVRSCRNYDLEVEIVTTELNGLAISGGGEIRTAGAFPRRGSLGLAISGGGEIDATSVEAGNVSAAINGGGAIRAHARDSLRTAINGGGEVRYRGDPRVSSAINGGGTVRPLGGR